MAESQQLPSQEQRTPPAATADAQRAGETGDRAAAASYWCYQCNKEVSAQAREEDAEGAVSSDMACAECQSGFIEAMATARPGLDRLLRRRRRRNAAQGRTRSLLDALEHVYPRQLTQILQMLDDASRPVDTLPPSQEPSSSDIQNESESMLSFECHTGAEGLDEGQAQTDSVPAGADGSIVNISGNSSGRSRVRIMREASVDRPEDAESGVEIESETEGLRLEFEGWDSADEDDGEEWEEVEDEEGAAAAGENGTETAVVEDAYIDITEQTPVDMLPNQETQSQGRHHPLVREIHNLFWARNIEENLQQYVQSLLQDLGGQNVEVLLELPDNTTYIGDPGDYVNAWEFELLLQQFAENDNSRRGAPPAAKTAIDAIPSVVIKQNHVADGASVCAICKESLCVGNSAKKLPCLHLYHQECILPWLSSRNSCPVCRYELPTDDPEYEEQKKTKSLRMRSGEFSSTGADEAYEEITNPFLQSEANAPDRSSEGLESQPSSSGGSSGSTNSEIYSEHVQGKTE